MIIVLDSSVYVSAMEYGGVPKQALIQVISSDDLLICAQIEDEVVRVMRDKFRHSANEIRTRLADYTEHGLNIPVTGKLAGICRDPKDDFILECAATGGADLIVTGDKDLLSLANYGRIEIVTPRQYLDRAAIEFREE